MLLREIKRPELQPKQNKPFQPGDMPDKFQLIGSGVGSGLQNSQVYLDKQDPNRVLKVVSIRDLSDPYLAYIRMVESHQNNPFFPRINWYKVYQQPDNSYLLYVFMEKLVPLSKFDPEVIKGVLSSIGIEYTGNLRIDFSLRQIMKNPKYRKNLKQSTQYPKFQEALRLLEPMFRKFGNDMHIENLMARLTSIGPQIVITDPLYPDFGFGHIEVDEY